MKDSTTNHSNQGYRGNRGNANFKNMGHSNADSSEKWNHEGYEQILREEKEKQMM